MTKTNRKVPISVPSFFIFFKKIVLFDKSSVHSAKEVKSSTTVRHFFYRNACIILANSIETTQNANGERSRNKMPYDVKRRKCEIKEGGDVHE